MKKVGVILLSGGLDSTATAAYAANRGYDLTAITLRYGQTHDREVEAAGRVAAALRLRHETVDVAFYRKLAWYSALTSPVLFSIPAGRTPGDMSRDIPITYVPLRNTFFITIAVAYLESEALALIERQGLAPGEIEASLFVAANAVDYSGYPDCRPEYYEALGKALFAGSKLGAQYGTPVHIQTPLIRMTKAEIVKLAILERAPIQYTWSCYLGGDKPCGQCDSCQLRAKGFAEADESDPALAPAQG